MAKKKSCRSGRNLSGRLVLLLCILWQSGWLSAQRSQPLGKDASGFETHLQAYLSADPNLGKEDKEAIARAIPAYLAFYAGLDEPLRERIAEIGRLSYTARLKAYPDLLQFLQLQQWLYQHQASWQQEWLDVLRGMLKKSRPRQFQSLVGRTSDLVREGLLYRSNAACWQVSNPEVSFHAKPEPCFRFAKTDLSCRAYQDSTVLYATSGVFYPMQDRFEGQGGDAYWDRVGLSPDSCQTRILRYEINLRQGRYEAAEAELYNLYLFSYPLRGRFIDKLTAGNRLMQGNYPQFVSEAELSVEDVFPGLDILGPFVQQGARTHFGSGERQAVLYVREENSVRAKITARRFMLEKGRLSAPEARFAMYLETDSLYNPVVSIRFDAKARIMHVGPVENYGLDVPFINTYHQLRMDFESMRWYLDRKKVEIGLLNVPGRIGTVSFKSLALYSRDELGRLMLGTEQNPLYLLASLARRNRNKVLTLDEVAERINMSSTQALALLRNPITFGFVSYDPVKKTVVLLPQLFHNLEVSAGKADFDELEFHTGEQGVVKAVLRTDSLDMRMQGVGYVLLSNKQNVYIRPTDSVVEIFRNRDFHFNGYLHAGTFNFQVRGGRFFYDDFKIDIADVQELGLEVEREEDGENKRYPVESVIRSLAGTVYIDEPGNKGGRQDFPQYPIFESKQPAYVYYDAVDIQGGAYTADSFYFKVDPFRMEKLNTLETDSIRFKGTLTSAGIFPAIREDLVVRPDYSLGFSTAAPEQGWPAYGRRAWYRGEVSLDRQGLWGNGRFSYLSSEAFSPHMTFLPHRMYMTARLFTLDEVAEEESSYPEIKGENVACSFYKNPTRYEVSSLKDSLLHCFAGDWLLEGRYVFSPVLSRAGGAFLRAGEARIASEDFSVRARAFSADSGDFRLGGPDKPFLYSAPYRLQVDLERQYGDFRSVDGHSGIEFGYNQYTGRAAALAWDMPAKTVKMQHGRPLTAERQQALDTLSPGDWYTVSLPGETFTSTRRAQAGLHFNAMSSELSYADTLLHFSGVKRVLVADALFVPAQEQLVIDRRGQMRSLQNARLYFGDRNRLHTFHQVNASILSARQYRASGLFDYKAPDLEVQPVLFTGIRPVSEGYSTASTRITADSGALLLNEAFQFIGKIELSARQTYPLFSGSVRMTYRCDFARTDSDGEEPESLPAAELASLPTESSPDYDDFEYVSDEEEGQDSGTLEVSVGDEEDDALAEVVAEDEPVWSEDDAGSGRGREENSGTQGSRRGRKKETEDVLLPAEDAARLKPGNPFLSDGIQFTALIDPDSVSIPVDERTRSTIGRTLGCGFYTPSRTGQPQFLFMNRKISTDLPNLAVAGYLNFSKRERSYRVFDSTGRNALSVSLGSCFARATGPINLHLQTYELGVAMYGDMMKEARSGEVSVRGLTMFDFYLSPDILRQIAAILNANSQLESAEIARRPHVDSYLQTSLGRRELERVRDEINLTGGISRIPEALGQTLVFSDLTFVWDPARKAWHSKGKAELLSVGGTAVNKKLTAYISLRRTRRGDVVDIYLEAASYAWFYFSYTNHYMQVLSSDDAFNAHLGALKGKTRKKGRYEFYLSTISKRNTFVNAFLSRDSEYQ